MIRFYLILLATIISCKPNNKKFTYYKNHEVKEVKTYFHKNDTSYYTYQLFYPSGIIKESGTILNSKKDGWWRKYYKDGMIKRSIYYKDGEKNYPTKIIPVLWLDPDSLRIGVETKIRFPNSHPYYGLSYDNATVYKSKDEDECDMLIIPHDADSVHFYYYDLEYSYTLDSITLSKSEINDPAKYGLSKEDFDSAQQFTFISKTPKEKKLMSLPIYK